MTRLRLPNCRPGLDVPGGRSGSILLIAAGTLVCLFIFALGYSRFLSRQSAMADKMIKRQKLGEFAAALATLTAHKLQFSSQTLESSPTMPSRPDKSPALIRLFEYLAKPLPQFDPVKEFEMPLDEADTAHFSMMLGSLWNAAGYGAELVEKIRIYVNKGDFLPTGPAPGAYTREKAGNLRINVSLRFMSGSRIVSSVDFDYACPVRICTVHAPVLSKFNLYIEDAALSPGDAESDYNQVSVNQMGNLDEARTKAVPLVLNNDDGQNLRVKRELRNFVEDPRGLVYLGGNGRLFLNLARSDVLAPNADSGEAFQFFRAPGSTGDGFYPIDEGCTAAGEKVFVSYMDQGVSDDPDPRISTFLSCIRSGQFGKADVEKWKMDLASLFRIFGVQNKISPTLVLGNVFARYLTIALLTGQTGGSILPQILQNLSYASPMNPPPYYRDLIGQPGYAALSQGFHLDETTDSYLKYYKYYSSRIRQRPYNQGLGFIDNQQDPDAPLSFSESDPLSAFVRPAPSAAPDPALHRIPGVFAGIYPDAADLKDLAKLRSPSTGLSRISYRFDNSGNTDALAILKKHNLVCGGRLAVNGWVSFSSGIRIDQPLEYTSGAGLIAETGDIVVSAPIVPRLQKANCLLYLAALDGNVIFDNDPGDKVQAAVIADSDAPGKGRVVFRRPPSSIRGALAMKKLVNSRDEAAAFKGTGLTYFAPLAALPAGSDGCSGDEGLLSYSFEQYPQELK